VLVYKYMPSDRFFGNFKFRLTPAEDLNDPRELVPDIRLRDPAAYSRDIVVRNLQSAFLRAQIANPDVEPEVLWARILSAAQQHMQSFDVEEKAVQIFDMFMRVTNRYVGVLSLSEDPLNELMWAHYANSHAGFVVGLDSESEFFQPKPKEPKVCGELMNVIYTDTTPVVFVEPKKLDIPREIFFTKTTKWSYEREWRMIKYLEQADEVVTAGGKKIHLFAVPKEAVKEVLFGHKVPRDVADQVQRDLSKTAPHVVVKQVAFSPKAGLTATPR
jgi:hypothetical protein